ncbi:unnamed protein product, partial [Ixodes persulcatus]
RHRRSDNPYTRRTAGVNHVRCRGPRDRRHPPTGRSDPPLPVPDPPLPGPMASGSLANGPLLAVEPGPMHMAPSMMHHGLGLMPPPVSATSTHVQQTQGSQGYPQLGAYAGYNGY